MTDHSPQTVRANLEQQRDRFDEAWQGSAPPEISEFLHGRAGPTRCTLLIELIQIDLEYRWRRLDNTPSTSVETRTLEAPLIEGYAQRFPELGPPKKALPLEMVAEEYRVRHCWGDRPGHGEYLRRFTHEAAALKEALRQIDRELADGADQTATRIDSPDPQASSPSIAATIDFNGSVAGDRAESPHKRRPTTKLPAAIGRYRLLKELGAGAFGVVYLARDEDLQRDVAVKVPGGHAQFGGHEAFQEEARKIAGLDRPGIVPVYDIGQTDGGRRFIVSKFIEDSSLTDAMRQQNVSHAQAAKIIATVARALQHAHSRKLVHRDQAG